MNIKRLVSKVSDKLGIERFKQVIKKRWLSVIIGIFLTWAFLIVRISLAENLVYISDDIYILGCEIFTESGPGPKLKEAAKRHKETLKEHKEYMRQRIISKASRFPVISWLLKDWHDYTAEKGIDKALGVLSRTEKETDQEKIAEAIWEAGEQLLEFREEMISFRRVGRIGIGFYKSTGVPKELWYKIIEGIDNSARKSDAFNKNGKSWEKAWALCEANRRSILLLFLARTRYKEKKIHSKLEVFKDIVEDSYEAKKAYYETFEEGSPVRKLLTLFAESDERRLGIVEALQKNDMDKARYLMWQAKEEAKLNKSEVLDILQAEEFKVAGEY